MRRYFIPNVQGSFLPKLTCVEALEPYRLRTQWSTGEVLEVDVGDILKRFKIFEPMLAVETFKEVHLSEGGGGVVWFEEEFEEGFGTDNVYAWAIEQTGQPSHEMFYVWLLRNRLSRSKAAQILGIGKRMVDRYATAREKIPWHIWYACVGYETLANNTGISCKDKSHDDVNKEFVTTSLMMFKTR